MRVDSRCASQESKRSGQTKMWRRSTRSNTRDSSRPSDRTLSDGVISPIGRDCFATRLRGYCAVPSDASGVGVGEALSAVSDNGEKDGDAELADVTEEVAAVSEVAGTDSTGIGVGRRLPGSGRPGSVPPGARSGSVTPGGRRGVRMVPPGDKAVAGFPDFSLIEGRRIGACGIPGASWLPVAPFLSNTAFLRALNSARRRSSSFCSASCSAANCRFTSRSIRDCISASVSCFWQEQNMVTAIITGRAKRFFMSGSD